MSERYPGGFVLANPTAPTVVAAPGIWTMDQVLQNVRAGTWPYASQPDAQFNYVTALFLGGATNGAQNNTFLDSSTNNLAVTRNGNTTQGSFTPYQPNGYWSNFFDGSGDYLEIANSTNLDFGSGDFTVECFVYFNSVATQQAFFSKWRVGPGYEYVFGYDPANGLNFIYGTTGAGPGNVGRTYAVTLSVGVWYHVAFCRSSGSTRAFVNGFQVGSTTSDNVTIVTTNQVQTVGIIRDDALFWPMNGYISNLRVVKGTALYTSNFNTSTIPLTAVTNTQLLTCQSNRFIDNSTNNFTLARNGDTSVQAFDPFGLPNPYSTGTSSGCGYFANTPGGGNPTTYPNFLQVTNAAVNLSGVSYTMEAWIYLTSRATGSPPQEGNPVFDWFSAFDNRWGLGCGSNGSLYIYTDGPSSGLSSAASVVPLNAWTHVAATWNGTTTRLFVNGTQVTSNTTNYARNLSALYIGKNSYFASGFNDLGCFQGYITDARIIKGSALYTSSFTPPTAPLTAITNTSLLLNFTNAGIYNAASQNTLETVGNAQVNTSVVKYAASMYFDGNGDYLTMPLNDVVQFQTANFTIEAWVYPLSTNHQSACIFSQEHISAINAPISIAIWLNNGSFETVGNRIGFGVYNGPAGSTWIVNAQNLATIPINTWTHIALSRVGSVFTMYVNGTPVGSATNATSCSLGSTQYFVGRRWDLSGSYPYFNGYISELRVTRGYARYWYPFTPPTLPSGTYYAPETAPATDPLFKNVTLLLPGNGTNGAQNNTFLDSSTNNFTITRNGNTTQGTFSPFSQTGWGNYFDGSGDYLDAGAQTAFAFGTGSWTVEAWVYVTTLQEILLFDTRSSASTAGVGCRIASDGTLTYSGSANNALTASAITANSWSHVAWVYDGTTLSGYINGTRGGTATPSFNITQNNGVIGRVGFSASGYIIGYVSNLRVVKGSAVYSGASFTVPTAPLTAITNTSLLTCQSNRFVDNSTNNFTVSIGGGTPSVQRFSPFAPTAPYAASTDGGSGYFDGSGDYLTVSQNAAFAFGTGDFTVEFWVNVSTYRTTPGGFYDCFLALGNFADSPYFRITPSGTAQAGLVANSLDGTTVFRTNTWYHYAVSRSGTTARLFINGVLEATVTNSSNLANGTAVYVGTSQWAVANETMTGLLSGLRILKGTALYTSNFTPPTAPPTAITNTSFLLNFTNAGIIDNAEMNNLETVGNAQISTAQSKFGGASMYFDGTGDYLQSPSSPQFSFDGDITIEAWIYPSVLSGSTAYAICGTHSGANDGKTEFYVYGTGRIAVGRVGVNEIASATGIISTGTWYHVAAVRSGSTTTVYVNGVSVASGTTAVWSTGASPIYVAYFNPSNGATWNGYIDDLRITRGVARYVQPFTPPTQAFQTS
jgi:hypothetical protein